MKNKFVYPETKDFQTRSDGMNKRWIFFLLGLLLLILSIPKSSLMLLEAFHEQQMNRTYTVSNISQGFPATPSTVTFNEQTIEINETLQNNESYTDPWNFQIGLGDVSLLLNGKKFHTINDMPVRIEEEGLNRYYGELALLEVEQHAKKKTSFFVLIKSTKEYPKEAANGDIMGSFPEDELSYTVYEIEENGDMSQHSFHFHARTSLETILLNKGYVTPYALGYYTNAWQSYPTLLFPFIFPFGTLLISFFLLFFFFPRKDKKTTF